MLKINDHPVFTQCIGEAHKNPYIDNCMCCMPWWEEIPHCDTCKTRLVPYDLRKQKRYWETLGVEKYHQTYGKCPTCKTIFLITYPTTKKEQTNG